MEAMLYLIKNNSDQLRRPNSIRDVLTYLVNDLEIVDTSVSQNIQRCVVSVFGIDESEYVEIDISKRGEIVVKTTRELSPLVKLRSSQLKELLADSGVVGEIRIVVGGKVMNQT
jgi:hypothetical protein